MASERDLLHELARRIQAGTPKAMERARSLVGTKAVQPAVESVQEKMGVALEGLGANGDEQLALETIVVRTGRPVLLVSDDDYKLEGPETEVWQDRLNASPVRTALRRILPAVGRIEVKNHRWFSWIGTGWLIDDDVIVTNRHVAEEFAIRSGETFSFRRGWSDPSQVMEAQIDFREEQGRTEASEFRVLDILHIEPEGGPDVALLKVNKKSLTGAALAGKLQFARTPAAREQFVATIGYPASDSRVPDQDLVLRLFGNVYNVKRLAPGQILKPRDGLVLHDCSTLGGNSGSPIVDLNTGEAVGLHFSGLFLEENRGVPANVVRDLLEKAKKKISGRSPRPDWEQPSTPPATPPVSSSLSSGVQTIRFDVTVPIEVTVRVGDAVATATVGAAGAVGAAGGGPSIEKAVAAVKAQLGGRSEVVLVREGYVFRDGWITDEPTVVVAVRSGAATPEAMGLPSRIDGVPVEVRPAGPSDFVEGMNLLEGLEGLPRTTYEAPDDVTLEEVEEEMRVVCHLCPDAGWPTLRDFLAETKKRLTVGIYDFTAPHIVDGVLAAVEKSPRKLMLVMQEGAQVGGSGTKKFDIPEDKTVKRYGDALDDRFQYVKASVGKDHRFASAYHIKVAVRDGKAFWLSSGNLQSSNQPNHEIADSSTGWDPLMKHNREWNVVIENEDLAGQFEAFLRHDFKQAQADVDMELPEIPDVEFLVEEALERVPFGRPTYFRPLEIRRKVRVRPLLTPDNYQERVLELIAGAEEQILFQNQSFSILDEGRNDSRYQALFDTLLAKQAEGLDLRIIVRGEFDAEKTVERLKKRGFDTNRIRLQDRCHTKGIIVDRRRVLVGSHNWTNQGALVNRDASLIFDDEEIARYFAEAFWFDWKKMARKSVEGGRRVRVADGRESPPAGMVSVSLQELLLG
jgi:V8-like Glu-specific endopeptidase